jgi:predicted nucleic acid-binding protein
LPGAKRIYFDTNVFILAVERPPAIETGVADVLINLITFADQKRDVEIHTSELTLSEILVQPYRNQDHTLITRYEGILSGALAVVPQPLNRMILRRAAALRGAVNAIKLPDAIHLATALESGCSLFLTADKDLVARSAQLELPFMAAYPSEHAVVGILGNPHPHE